VVLAIHARVAARKLCAAHVPENPRPLPKIRVSLTARAVPDFCVDADTVPRADRPTGPVWSSGGGGQHHTRTLPPTPAQRRDHGAGSPHALGRFFFFEYPGVPRFDFDHNSGIFKELKTCTLRMRYLIRSTARRRYLVTIRGSPRPVDAWPWAPRALLGRVRPCSLPWGAVRAECVVWRHRATPLLFCRGL